MSDSDFPESREHSPQAWLEKKVAVMGNELKELKEWKIKHDSDSNHDSDTLEKLSISIDGHKGKGGIFGDGGLDDKVKEIITTVKNIWKYIAVTGILVGILSNLDKLVT